MKVFQKGAFARRVKKLHANEKKALDRAVKKILESPDKGKLKTGDLGGIQVFKYKVKSQQYLLAYHFDSEAKELTLIAIGSHENFYRDIKS